MYFYLLGNGSFRVLQMNSIQLNIHKTIILLIGEQQNVSRVFTIETSLPQFKKS